MSYEGKKLELELRYGGPNGKANMEQDALTYSQLGFWGRFFHRISGYNRRMPCKDKHSLLETEKSTVNLSFDEVKSLMIAAVLEHDENLEELPSVLYLFQHVVLRNSAFENDKKLWPELNKIQDHPDRPLMHFQCLAHVEREELSGHSETEDEFEKNEQLFEQLKVHKPFDRSGYIVHLIEFGIPEGILEAYFVAILKGTNDLRYFTLEKSNHDTTDYPLLCELLMDGNRKNYGLSVLPTPDRFINAIFDHIDQGNYP